MKHHQWQLDAGLEQCCFGRERCGLSEQRAVVGRRDCDGCGAGAGQPQLQQGCARGPQVCVQGRHDGRDGMRRVSMVASSSCAVCKVGGDDGGGDRRGQGQGQGMPDDVSARLKSGSYDVDVDDGDEA